MPFDDLEYADDVSFRHRSPTALHNTVQQAKEQLGEWELRVNDAKAYIFEVRRGGSNE